MRTWSHWLFATLAVAALGACSSSSGCGMTPLPGGFDRKATVQNAATVRLTKSGLEFIERNVGAIATKMAGSDILTFPIEKSTHDAVLYDVTVCPSGPDPSIPRCTVEAKVSGTKIDLSVQGPHELLIQGTVPVRLADLPVNADNMFVENRLHVILTNGGCSEHPRSFASIPFSATISVFANKDTSHAARLGYTRMEVTKVSINQKALNDSVDICGDSGVAKWLAEYFKDDIVEDATKGLSDKLKDSLNEQLCEKARVDADQFCPDGSQPGKNDICFYDDGSCVSRMLGMDGHLDLGAAFRSFSPSTTGGIDILLAAGGEDARSDEPSLAWGDLYPVNGGATIGLFGGALPNPVSSCVTPVDLPIPKDIPQPDELLSNDLDGWQGEGPHLGFALSERYMNLLLGAAYNSGVFCLGFSTDQKAELNSAALGTFVPSLKRLTLRRQKAPMALVLRPSQPPTLTVGDGTDQETDPLLLVEFKDLDLDFYIWSADRYIRAFTLRFDLAIPAGVDVTANGLVPQIYKLVVRNTRVSHSDLLLESHEKIASKMGNIVDMVAGKLVGQFKPYDISDALASLGLRVKIEPGGIRKLEKGSDRFLGIFASLALASSTTSFRTDTIAHLENKFVVPAGLRVTTLTDDNRPKVTISVESESEDGAQVEYSYRIDGGYWHPWTTDDRIVVSDSDLLFQGRHLIEVRSRVVGKPETEDPTPAQVPVLIDVTPPRLRVDKRVDGVELTVWDHETDGHGLQFRYAMDDGTWTDWRMVRDGHLAIPADGAEGEVRVQVRDEEGNVATKRLSLIRGRPDEAAVAGGGCGCRVGAGADDTGRGTGEGWLLALLLGAMLLDRRWGVEEP